MGAWGPGPLENDDAWNFVNDLVEGSPSERARKLRAALEVAARGGRLDITDASDAVVAALLVAAARDPGRLTAERTELVDHTAAVHDVSTFGDLVGDLRAIRTARAADLALRAIETVVEDSELRDLSETDLDGFVSSFDDIRAALRSPLRPWTAAAAKPAKVESLRRRWVAGTLLSTDLGDGYRSYAQLLEISFVACYDARQPVTEPVLSPAVIVSRPVLFTIAVNEYMDRPAGWMPIGSLPEGHTVLPAPTRFKQEIGNAQECYLVVGNDWERMIPLRRRSVWASSATASAGYPENLEEQLRYHYAGRPHPETEYLRVRISHSLVRVSTRDEARAGYDAGHFPPPNEAESLAAFYPAHLVPHFAARYGPNRDDLVMVEVDEAAMGRSVTYRPAVPDDPGSPLVPWTRSVSRNAVLGVHDLVPTIDGSYQPARPWTPVYA